MGLDYKLIFEHSQAGLICLDSDGRLLVANPAAHALLGMAAAADADYPQPGSPASRDRAQAALQADGPLAFEDILGEGRDSRLLGSTWQALPTAGQPAVLVTLRDCTRRHRAETALADSETILNHTQKVGRMGSWHANLKDNSITWSDGLYNLFGMDKVDGLPPSQAWQPAARPTLTSDSLAEGTASAPVEERISQALNGEAPYIDEFAIVRQDTGETRFIHSTGQVLLDDQGRPERMIGTLQDITDQKKREEEITYISYHDSLTGLYNRRFFEEELRRLDTRRQLPLSIIIGDVNGLKLVNDVYGHQDGDALLRAAADLLRSACRTEDLISRWGGDEFIVCLPRTDAAAADRVLERIAEQRDSLELSFAGHRLLSSISLGSATKTDDEQDIHEIIRDAENAMYSSKLVESRTMHRSAVQTMRRTLFERGIESREHAERLAILCRHIGQRLGLPEPTLEELSLLAQLHDIGKIIIDRAILDKPDKLTDDEWLEIRRHTETGYRIAKSTPELTQIAESILTHHEQWDGNGYPQGLAGDAIPLPSRILAVADAYDTMTHDRPYSETLSHDEAAAVLRQEAGRQFDPQLVPLLLEIAGETDG